MQLRDNTNIWLQEAKFRIFLKNSLVSVVLNDIDLRGDTYSLDQYSIKTMKPTNKATKMPIATIRVNSPIRDHTDCG